MTRVAGGQDPAVPAAAAAQPVISSPASAAQRRHPIQHQVPSQSQQSQSIFLHKNAKIFYHQVYIISPPLQAQEACH